MGRRVDSNAPKLDAEEILDGILEWVEIETPSMDAEAVNGLADRVETAMQTLGLSVERTPGRDGFGDILKARTPWGGDGPGILVLSHMDTVHPIGTKTDTNPIRRDDDQVFGPGIYDMKAGAYIGLHALRHLIRLGRTTPLPITFLFVPDEEVCSPTSRDLIVEEGKRAKYVLVTEPAREGGKVVTARKGRLEYRIEIAGRPAHAGGRHMDGRSAIREMAHQILRLEALTDYTRGITCSVGTIQGGTFINVVPSACEIAVDVRVPDMPAAQEVMAQIEALGPVDPDCTISISGGLDRPPYEKTEANAQLFECARLLAAEIGLDLEDMKAGGGSDGNFTGALGIPTLDGLGADGHGAHTFEECIYVSSLVERTALMLRLYENLN